MVINVIMCDNKTLKAFPLGNKPRSVGVFHRRSIRDNFIPKERKGGSERFSAVANGADGPR